MPVPVDKNIFHLKARIGSFHPETRADEQFVMYGNPNTLCILLTDNLGRYRSGVAVIDDYGQDRTEDANGGFIPIFEKVS